MAEELQWEDLDSSMIHSIAAIDDKLFVRFKDRSGRITATYSYDAPGEAVQLMKNVMEADSAGRYLNSEIKGVYPHQQETDV
jgi:uncharacterized membrane protein